MDRLTNTDRLRSLYAKDGPFVSFFTRVEPESPDPTRGFLAFRDDALEAGATQAAVDAVEARLQLPIYGDVEGQAIVASADGSTAVDLAHEGPEGPVLFVDRLPYAAPFLEWQQWRVAHLAVVASSAGYEVASFVPGEPASVRDLGDDLDGVVARLARDCRDDAIELLLIAGDAEPSRRLADAAIRAVPTHTQVTQIDGAGDLASSVVRMVADHVARSTVALLKEFRVLLMHDDAVQGVDDTLHCLARGEADVLLIHDDPTDGRRAWFGEAANDVSPVATAACPHEGRLVDVAVRSAILQDARVRIIPTTGEGGPDDDIGALIRNPMPQPPV